MTENSETDLLETPLASLHRELGARMVPFAGYSMPVQYPKGILTEHNWTRENAGLFDVSHMGQALLIGPDHETTARALEALTPGDFQALAPGRVRYTLLTTDHGGIIDDLMVTRPADPAEDGTLGVIVNAGRKTIDYAHFAARLPHGVRLDVAEDRALLALQGPKAAEVFARHCPAAAGMGFMTSIRTEVDGVEAIISRSGYTGEDGYEISVPGRAAEAVARALLAEPEVEPIGLGARDSLRLEAGLCLYGHDIDEVTSPAEADLGFAIAKRRRVEGGFPGADRILGELADGAPRLRVGIRPEGRAPAREGTEIRNAQGSVIGIVTSGGFGPTVGGPIAMGYVAADYAAPGTPVFLSVRGKDLAARVEALPFVPHRYYRKPSV
ncbi:glycine cleavage system protein T [Kaistia algarum]|uniref:glycine cleavage system aminomethyltransferase GcvT n=1 Tax=Kaistia algarum TaxID=2083279 RepID=UPI000CE7851D|nr:glycine cleavage system aminomethyltransferase GcvT [Kaistia algarum]MCX5512364.1 glycine cleavage system aminomethyltransferase GcvT [Kaistia algarum]PPE80447.1 glycine cleavage system protein T [Kaistia algarum]